MHYLIDGYNFLFFYLSEFQDLQAKREEIIDLLQSKLRKSKLQITIVFDGAHIYGEESGFQYLDSLLVAFSSKDQTADEFILEKISFTFHPNNFTIVTSDKGLAKRAREIGAKTQSIDAFLKWIYKKNKKISTKEMVKESPQDIERLLKIFQKRLKEDS